MLNMRSMPMDDATTRSRIRDAAVLLFGRDGYAATSVRAIAETAGVSAGLVIHHFGSKEALRQACDQHIVAEVMGRKDELDSSGDPVGTMQGWLADAGAHRGSLDYLGRMILDGTPAGDRLFDSLVDGTEALLADEVAAGRMRPSDDPRARAVVVATHSLANLVLERQLGRALGDESGLGTVALRRMTLPILELYTYGLYADDTMLKAAAEALSRDDG